MMEQILYAQQGETICVCETQMPLLETKCNIDKNLKVLHFDLAPLQGRVMLLGY